MGHGAERWVCVKSLFCGYANFEKLAITQYWHVITPQFYNKVLVIIYATNSKSFTEIQFSMPKKPSNTKFRRLCGQVVTTFHKNIHRSLKKYFDAYHTQVKLRATFLNWTAKRLMVEAKIRHVSVRTVRRHLNGMALLNKCKNSLIACMLLNMYACKIDFK